MRAFAVWFVLVMGSGLGCGDDPIGPTVTVTAQPARVLADGREATNIVVRVLDEAGQPQPGLVTLSIDGEDNVVDPHGDGTTDGIVATKLRSATAGPRTIRATFEGHQATAAVTFTALAAPCAGVPAFGLPMLDAPGIVVDLDGNGTLDLISSPIRPSSAPTLRLSLGQGDGTFRAVQEIPSDAGFVIVADFDEDANVDVLTLTQLWRGTGTGTVAAGAPFVPGRPWHRGTHGDFDGDGLEDVVVFDQLALAIFHGNGDGTFDEPVLRDVVDQAVAFAAADFDLDGRSEIVASTTSGQALVFRGRADRTIGDPTAYRAPAYATQATVARFDGDAHLDIGIVGGDGALQLLRGVGDGTFAVLPEIDLPVPISQMQTGDVDRDGDLDLVINGAIVHRWVGIEVWLGDGTGAFVPSFAIEGRGGVPSALGNFDGDDQPDLMVWLETGAAIARGDGTGRFAMVPARFAQNEGNGLVAADLDHDGAPDIVSFRIIDHPDGSVTGELQTFRNTGGMFEQVSTLAESLVPQATGDFDRDGRIDVIFIKSVDPARPATLVVALDHGAFASLHEYPLSPFGAQIVVEDVDRDHVLDLLLLETDQLVGTSELSLWRGNPDGTFREGTPIAKTLRYLTMHFLADRDGDGQLDVGLAGSTEAQLGAIEWLRGAGDGSFAITGDVVLLPDGVFPVAALPVELDGRPRPEVVVLPGFRDDGLHRSVLVVPSDDGVGSYYDTGVEPAGLDVVDTNRDGNLDVVVASQHALSVLVSDGQGRLLPFASFAGGGRRFAVADFDDDGRRDFASDTGFIHGDTGCLAR